MKIRKLKHAQRKDKLSCMYCGEKLPNKKGGRIYCFDCYNWQNGSWRTIIFKRDGEKCFYCGIKLTKRNFCVDHVIPASKQGRSIAGNIVCCCHQCNGKKSTSRLYNETGVLEEIKTRNNGFGIDNELIMPMYRFGTRGWESELSYLGNTGESR